MRILTKEERQHLETMISSNPTKRNGYLIFQKQIDGRKYRIKRSRAIMQLHLNKKLEIWEIVHHKDGDRENDSIENLEVVDSSDFDYHTSLHHAGKRGKDVESKNKGMD